MFEPPVTFVPYAGGFSFSSAVSAFLIGRQCFHHYSEIPPWGNSGDALHWDFIAPSPVMGVVGRASLTPYRGRFDIILGDPAGACIVAPVLYPSWGAAMDRNAMFNRVARAFCERRVIPEGYIDIPGTEGGHMDDVTLREAIEDIEEKIGELYGERDEMREREKKINERIAALYRRLEGLEKRLKAVEGGA